RLAENHDVWNNSLRFESPEMRAQASKTDLNFIRDANAACGAHKPIDLGKIVRGKHDLPRDARQSLCKISHPPPLFLEPFYIFADVRRIFFAKIFFSAAIQTSIVVRNRR